MANFYVYILTNKNHTVLYTGFTDDLERRVYEHKNKLIKGFTSKYNLFKLVYFEEFNDGKDALAREKQIKKYKRKWKEHLIYSTNPQWIDLYDNFTSIDIEQIK
ncbi:GIY-YIG nuclease family protein [Cytophagaceae bacterium ABcell3]|nr:GIY-YIG nuclease family protein [Cytophagaceae bacterium ABcell3]